MNITNAILLKSEVIDLIRENKRLKNRLQLELNVSESTLYRYLADNNDRLTTATALYVISEETGISQDDLLRSASAD